MAPPKTKNGQSSACPGNVTSIGAHLAAPSTYRLTVALQTTLEMDQLIEIFSGEANETVRYNGCVYRTPEEDDEITTGTPARHSARYDLNLAGEALGNITFFRQQRFSEHELLQLEHLLCALLYPLRNALQFRGAQKAAYKDPLTGLGNRAAMEDALCREIELARRQHSSLALLAIDLDHFKRVNDSHGHTVGDRVLHATAERMRSATRASDLLFRYGGEEFVAVLAQTGRDNARMVAERIRSAINGGPFAIKGSELAVSASIGVAAHHPGDRSRTLFDRADRALYAAKHGGRNCVIVDENGATSA